MHSFLPVMSDAAGLLHSLVRPQVDALQGLRATYRARSQERQNPYHHGHRQQANAQATSTMNSNRRSSSSMVVQTEPDICCAAGEVSEAAEALKRSPSQTLPASIGCSAIRETEPPKLLGGGRLQLAQLQLCGGKQRAAEDCAPLLLRPRMLLDKRLNPLQPCLHGGRARNGS